MPPFFELRSQIASSQRHFLNLRNYLPSTLDLHRSLSSPSPPPTKTLRSIPPIVKTLASVLHPRQVNPSIVPSTYSGINSGPEPGTVVGIVLGSVGGFLLLLWLIYTCFNFANPSSAVYEEEIVRRHSHSPRRPVSRSRSRSEVIEVRQHRSPPRQRSPHREVRRETVVVEETTRRPERDREDFVEVIEEHSPPPPRRSRGSGSGGRYYRTVDPGAFGGGSSAPRRFRR
ncbi:hypothetical protein MMC07_004348 [Pseudocyphellaria aurata]|nr:hypothetical protein [Pseudocyphellaria aurata]